MTNKSHHHLDADQAATLISPVRSEILVALITLDKASVKELAAYLGRSPKALYHHLRQMANAGIIVQVDSRRSGAREEAVYAPISNALALPKSDLTAQHIAASLRMATREAERAPLEAVLFIRMGLRLGDQDRAELRQRLRDLSEWAHGRMDLTGARIACTLLLTEGEPESMPPVAPSGTD